MILVSCLIKVAVQLEFGKNAIVSGRPLMHEFNLLQGGKVLHANWAVWATFVLTLFKILQLGGMLGGAAIVLNLLFPAASVVFWIVLLGISLSLLIYKNYYRLVEKASMLMVFGFTLFTIVSLFAVFFIPRLHFHLLMSCPVEFQTPSGSSFCGDWRVWDHRCGK